jgi:prepilin-type N-terminal cleavage/methylation domain-containing protein
VIPARASNSHSVRRAFTLVEMLAVIAVLAILLVAGVGLLGGTSAQARKSATDALGGMIEQARTSAITSRSHVVLAIAEPGDLPANDKLCRIGLFKVAIDQWPPNPASAEIPAVLMSRWKTLENGVILINGQPANQQTPNALDGDELTIKYRDNVPAVKVHAIAFNSRGGLIHPIGSSPLLLRLAEGGYRNGQRSPNQRNGEIAENLLKIGRVTGRSYRIDG